MLPTDIVLLVYTVRKSSFARTDSNKKIMAKRSWVPFNRNLLTTPEIRATMTEQDLHTKCTSKLIPFYDSDKTKEMKTPTFNPHFLIQQSATDTTVLKLSYSNPMSLFCINSLVQYEDLMKVWEWSKKEQEDG